MFEDLLTTFTDRREALALFEHLRHREPDQHAWPLLPILTFIAPGGSGKSTLIEYLISGRCYKNGRAILPYAHIDFTRETQLRDLLSILIALRDRLQSHADEQGRYLTFPRFDLGAAIANESPLGSHLPALGHDEIRRSMQVARSAFKSINEMGNSLGNAYPYIPPLLVALQWAGQAVKKVPGLHELLLQLTHDSAWQWYSMSGLGLGLSTDAGVSEVLVRLHALGISSRPNKEGRDYLINHVLPAAFVADLLEGLDGSASPRTWNATANIILFLDGFEALLESSYTTAMRLLEVLALNEGRKQGETDPLLLVIGSRTRLLEHIGVDQQQEQYPSLDLQTRVQDELLAREYASECYGSWHQRLPKNIRYLRLNHLYLPQWLYDFGLNDTRYYLSQIDRQKQTQAFADETLVKAMHAATHGHPLYLALAAAAVLEAQANGKQITPSEFEKAPIPVDLKLEQLEGQQDKRIGEYLLSLFLRQLTEQEQDEFIFCAMPRALDRATLRALLQLPSDVEAQKKLDRYLRLTFVTARIVDEKIVLHPIVRSLLLRKLALSREPESDYYRLHTRLREHFNKHATNGDEQAHIEEAYHALALGDPQPTIELGTFAQRAKLALWEPLLEAVAQAPTEFMPADTEQHANSALVQAGQYHVVQDAVKAIILYKWLIAAFDEKPLEAAHTQTNLGAAYNYLLRGDRQANLEKAIVCYQTALRIYTREIFPMDWAMIQNNLSSSYWALPGEDRQANLEKAITCSEAALQVYTPESFPANWAMAQYNLGNAYRDLPKGDRQKNVMKAIACYKATLKVYTPESFPFEWARTQNSLGNAYRSLPTGNRKENTEKAIAYYEAALKVHTRESYPLEWAMTHLNLGNAYSDLSTGDKQKNMEQAIACYKEALQTCTRESFPLEWALIQNNLGKVYRNLPKGDQQKNAKKAIACYEAALQVHTRESYPLMWASTQNNLGNAYRDLPEGDRQKNVKRAIACYEAALQVHTRESSPFEWARAQNNLGDAYRGLPEGDRQESVKKAIACYEATLQIYTQESFPFEWARTQGNLGNAYLDFPMGDRQKNVEQAIACYKEALQIYTRESSPFEWALTQNNLGKAYRNITEGDRQGNVKKAIAYYEVALEVHTRESSPFEWAIAQNNLGDAYCNLPEGDQRENVKKAIAYYEAALQVLSSMHMNYQVQMISENLEKAQEELYSLEQA